MRAKHNVNWASSRLVVPPFDKEVYGPIWDAAKKGNHEIDEKNEKKTKEA